MKTLSLIEICSGNRIIIMGTASNDREFLFSWDQDQEISVWDKKENGLFFEAMRFELDKKPINIESARMVLMSKMAYILAV